MLQTCNIFELQVDGPGKFSIKIWLFDHFFLTLRVMFLDFRVTLAICYHYRIEAFTQRKIGVLFSKVQAPSGHQGGMTILLGMPVRIGRL